MLMSALLHPAFRIQPSRTPDANVCTPALPHSAFRIQHPASQYDAKYRMNNLYNKIILRNFTAASATRNGGTAASACRHPKAWQTRYLHGKRTIHYLNQTFDNYVHTQNGRTRIRQLCPYAEWKDATSTKGIARPPHLNYSSTSSSRRNAGESLPA